MVPRAIRVAYAIIPARVPAADLSSLTDRADTLLVSLIMARNGAASAIAARPHLCPRSSFRWLGTPALAAATAHGRFAHPARFSAQAQAYLPWQCLYCYGDTIFRCYH